MEWRFRDHVLDLSRRGEIMAILNVTPDSFSDGGEYEQVETAARRALQMLDEGAAIIDVGGESTRPGAGAVAEEEEIRRVVPVIEKVIAARPDALISIDTMKPAVARAALAAGAAIINDVSGFRDPGMIAVAAETGAGAVVMHMQGTPRTMQESPTYDDVRAEVKEFFEDRFAALIEGGVLPERIVLDPGIGFGKTLEHNLALLRELPALAVSGRPLLLGVSRKSFLGTLTGNDDPAGRDLTTAAVTSFAREQGVLLHRVHSVRPNLESLRMTEGILNGVVG